MALACPVCSDVIDRLLDARQQGTDTDGAPRCGLLFWRLDSDENRARLEGGAFDFTPPVSVELRLDGEVVFATESATRYAGAVEFLQREGKTRTAALRCTDGRGLISTQRMTLNY